MTNDKRNERKSFFKSKSGFKKNSRFGNKHSKIDEKKIKDRIAKRLAMLGVASRREAEKIVLDGKVKINGIECKDLSQLVSYEDKIAVNGKEIVNKPIRTQIFIMNKPAGYVTSNNDPQGRKTIFELIPSKFGRLVSIGRLDYNTEGILLLTNNGELARIMEMPATGLKRVYYARVVGEINNDIKTKLENLKQGIKIEGVEYGKMIVEINDYSQTRATLRIVIFEGKNNEIRRIMWHFGLKVVKLTRVQYGDFRLNGIPEGCIQESHFKVDLRDLERQASINIKKYNFKKAKLEQEQKEKEESDNKKDTKKEKKAEDKKVEKKEKKTKKVEEQTNLNETQEVLDNEENKALENKGKNDKFEEQVKLNETQEVLDKNDVKIVDENKIEEEVKQNEPQEKQGENKENENK